jgi:beta-lactamase class A
MRDLEASVRTIADNVAADWAIYIKLVGTGEELAINADTSMDTMSVIKVPLLVTLMRRADAGEVDLTRRVVLDDERRRWGTGVLKYLDNGLSVTLRDAAALMIGLSDNVATDLCFEAVGGPRSVTQEMAALGLPSIQATGTALDWNRAVAASVDGSLIDVTAAELFRVGHPAPPPIGSSWLSPVEASAVRERFHFGGGRPFGLASARELARLMEMIWNGDCASKSSCHLMIDLLRAQHYGARVPKYLQGAIVAHKTGDFGPFIANDVAVIEGEDTAPVVACFFSTHHRGEYASLEDAIARMSEKVWDYARWSTARTNGFRTALSEVMGGDRA